MVSLGCCPKALCLCYSLCQQVFYSHPHLSVFLSGTLLLFLSTYCNLQRYHLLSCLHISPLWLLAPGSSSVLELSSPQSLGGDPQRCRLPQVQWIQLLCNPGFRSTQEGLEPHSYQSTWFKTQFLHF